MLDALLLLGVLFDYDTAWRRSCYLVAQVWFLPVDLRHKTGIYAL